MGMLVDLQVDYMGEVLSTAVGQKVVLLLLLKLMRVVFSATAGSAANYCYWDTETSGLSVSGVGTGKTTVQMKDISTYLTDYSIADINSYVDEVWYIDDDNNYPELGWQYDGVPSNTVQVVLVNTNQGFLANTDVLINITAQLVNHIQTLQSQAAVVENVSVSLINQLQLLSAECFGFNVCQITLQNDVQTIEISFNVIITVESRFNKYNTRNQHRIGCHS